MAGGDDHRQVGMGADLAQEVQPVFLAEPEVEDDQARLARRQVARHFLAAGRGVGRHAVLPQIIDDHLVHQRVVIDDEDLRRRIAFVRHFPINHLI